MSKQKTKTDIAGAYTRRAELLGSEQHRSYNIELREDADPESRAIEIAFSSEEPYERVFGTEVLDHNPGSIRLSRLRNAAPLLVNHDTDDQVGVVESARIDSDGKGRAVVRFSRSTRGDEIFQDVRDGIRQLVSVGYRIHDYDAKERDGLPDLVRVTDWEPFEVSIVAIPADSTVGVGRSVEKSQTEKTDSGESTMNDKVKETEETRKDEAPAQPRAAEPAAPAVDREKELRSLRTEEAKRRSDIDSLADKYGLQELGREAVTEGWSIAKFNEKALAAIGEHNSQVRAKSSHDGEVDLSSRERSQFSLMRLMAAISNPNDRRAQQDAAFELEVSADAQRGFGSDFNCRGEFIPTSVFERVLSAGTATDGAELVATNLLSGSYIDVLRNASSVMQAGATMLPGLVGDVAIPRQTSGAAATWITAEDGDAAVGEAQFDQVTMTPKDLACYTEVTRRLLLQSTPAIEGIVRNDLIVAQALGIDLAALYGSGAAGQPLGISGQTGVNNFNFGAADPTYAEIVRMIKEVMTDNALTGTPVWIIEANGWEALSTTAKQGTGVEGNFILGDSDTVKGYNYIMSNQVTAEDYFFGDFSQVLVGEWGGLEINVDPYTHSLKGKIRYVMFKTVDVAVRHGEHFSFCNDGV